jgi:hypothetical protein
MRERSSAVWRVLSTPSLVWAAAAATDAIAPAIVSLPVAASLMLRPAGPVRLSGG